MINFKSFDLRKIGPVFHKIPERLGVHLEKGTARIVHLKENGIGGYKLASHGEVAFNLAGSTSAEQRSFQEEFDRIGGGVKNLAVNIEHPSLRIRKMVLPDMPENDMLEAIRWNFREQIGVPMERYSVGYVPLSIETEQGKISTVAYGVAQDAIDEYLTTFRGMGLKVVSLEPAASALLASFYINGVLNDDSIQVCIALGETLTNFVVMRSNEMLFSRPLAAISLSSLKSHFMGNVSVDKDGASQLASKFIVGGGAISDAPNMDEEAFRKSQITFDKFFSDFVLEIKRSIDAFCILYGIDRVGILHICGGRFTHPNLISSIEDSIKVKCKVYDPFYAITEKGNGTEALIDFAAQYAVAVGLAVPQE